MNTYQTPAVTTSDEAWLVPERRLERRSSLLTCCKSPKTSSTLNVSPLMSLKSSFPIREQSGVAVAVCQPHGNKTFTLFCPRPLSPGQKPSLTIRGSILYRLGRATLKDDSSGTIELWNKQIVAFQKPDDAGKMALQRPDHLFLTSSNSTAASVAPMDKQQAALFDRVLLLCAEYLLDLESPSFLLAPAAPNQTIC